MYSNLTVGAVYCRIYSQKFRFTASVEYVQIVYMMI